MKLLGLLFSIWLLYVLIFGMNMTIMYKNEPINICVGGKCEKVASK